MRRCVVYGIFLILLAACGSDDKNPAPTTKAKPSAEGIIKAGQVDKLRFEDFSINVGVQGVEPIHVRIISAYESPELAIYVVRQGQDIHAGRVSGRYNSSHKVIKDAGVIEAMLTLESSVHALGIDARFPDFLRYLKSVYYFDTYRCRDSKYTAEIERVWNSDRGPVAFYIGRLDKHGIDASFHVNINSEGLLKSVTLKSGGTDRYEPLYVRISDMSKVIHGEKAEMLVEFTRFGIECGDAYRHIFTNIFSDDRRLPPLDAAAEPRASSYVDRALDRAFPGGDYVRREMEDDSSDSVSPRLIDEYFAKIPMIYFTAQ